MFFKKKIEPIIEEPETGNTLKKGKQKDAEKEGKPKSGATIKSSLPEEATTESKPNAFVEFLKREKTKNIVGLTFLLSSLYLFIAFTSYLFTWQEDQDKVIGSWWTLLSDSSIVVNNWLGKLGAIVSHVFFYRWFGVVSFVFAFLLAIMR